MRNKFIRNSLLMACASVALSNAYAMEEELTEKTKGVQAAMKPATHSQIAAEKQWTITEGNTRTSYCDFNFSKNISIESLKADTYIQKMVMGVVDKKDDIFVRIIPTPWFKQPQDHKNMKQILKEDLKLNNISYQSNVAFDDFMIICADKITPASFLSVFYNRDLIPDFIMVLSHLWSVVHRY